MAHMVNALATAEQIYKKNGDDPEVAKIHNAIFFNVQCLTQAAGLLLELPQSITAQANVLLARYWLTLTDIPDYEYSDISAAILYLTTKLSADPRSPRDITNVYTHLTSSASPLRHNITSADSTPYLSQSTYHAFHTRILTLEGHILAALSFNTHVSLPHPLAITYLQTLDFLLPSSPNLSSASPSTPSQPKITKKSISQLTLAYLNTALLSPQLLYLTHQPNTLAVAAIYSAARDLGAKMPQCEWWEVFDVDREDLGFLVAGLRSLGKWIAQLGEEMPELMMVREGGGVITLKMVEAEMARRGLVVGGEEGGGDAEEAAMRRMDRSMAEIEPL